MITMRHRTRSILWVNVMLIFRVPYAFFHMVWHDVRCMVSYTRKGQRDDIEIEEQREGERKTGN